MAFETILINAGSEHCLPGLLDVAAAIATRHHSHVLGLSNLFSAYRRSGSTSDTPAVDALERHRNAVRTEASRMRRLFERTFAGKAFTSEWRHEDADDLDNFDALVGLGRLADLIVTSNDDSTPLDAHPSHAAERLIVEAGRPVILVPNDNSQSSCGHRVLVAWNGSREATRSVFDAMPLLQTAQHVKVIQIGANETDPVSGLGGAALCGVLSRHGIRAQSEELALPRATAGAALLSAVKAENADLLVMGSYGHWRFREFIPGGATRHVLQHMTVPVFMSH